MYFVFLSFLGSLIFTSFIALVHILSPPRRFFVYIYLTTSLPSVSGSPAAQCLYSGRRTWGRGTACSECNQRKNSKSSRHKEVIEEWKGKKRTKEVRCRLTFCTTACQLSCEYQRIPGCNRAAGSKSEGDDSAEKKPSVFYSRCWISYQRSLCIHPQRHRLNSSQNLPHRYWGVVGVCSPG